MLDTWNKFVWKLIECKNKNVEEAVYHNLIEDKLELLGWAAYRGEICHKAKIPIGSNGNIQPDILMKRDDENQFVIEVKRPNHTQRERELRQLFSYMLQLRLKIGVYIGEHIEIFYDQPDNDADPVSVYKIALEMDNKSGASFVNLFQRDTFDKEKIGQWCEERVLEMQRRESLNRIKEGLMSDEGSRQIARSVRQYLIDTYGTEFSEQAIDEMLQTMVFRAVPKNEKTIINSRPKTIEKGKKKTGTAQGPAAEDTVQTTTIPCFLQRGKLQVKGVFYLNSQGITLPSGIVINKDVAPSFRPAEIRRRAELIDKYAEIRNGELVIRQDVHFQTPSGAAVFCIGGSANGWEEWKDANGRSLQFYRKKKEK